MICIIWIILHPIIRFKLVRPNERKFNGYENSAAFNQIDDDPGDNQSFSYAVSCFLPVNFGWI